MDNDGRIFSPPSGGNEDCDSLWVEGLMTGRDTEQVPVQRTRDSWLDPIALPPPPSSAGTGWLAGLVKEEPAEVRPTGRSWLGDLIKEKPNPAATSSWLAGLIKTDARPAINDITRLIFSEPAAAPTLSPLVPLRPPEVPEIEAEELAAPRLSPSQTCSSPILGGVETDQKQGAQTQEVLGGLTPSPVLLASRPPQSDYRPSDTLERESSRLSVDPSPVTPAAPLPFKPKPPLHPQPPSPQPVLARTRWKTISGRDRASFYNSLTTMYEAGVPLFAIFEFLARQGESAEVVTVSRRIGQNLVSGMSLHAAVAREPQLFDAKAVRLIEVGYRSGGLPTILAKLAEDEEQVWRLKSMLKSQLAYPCCIALIALAAVIVLPPLVLTDLLKQVVSLTAEPPLLTQWLLKFSALISSPWTLMSVTMLMVASIYGWRSPRGRIARDNLEPAIWFLPGIGPLWRNLIGMRFLKVFSLTYQSGLPATLGMELAAGATGSQLAYRVHPLMKRTLMEGGNLTDAFQVGGFLPMIALEAINAGEAAGSIPVMLESATQILSSEVESRVDAVAKLVEPLVLACLGLVVGVFVLGCLLPIVELTEKL